MRLKVDMILRRARRVTNGKQFSSPTVVARLGQSHASYATVNFNREIKELRRGLLVRLIHGTCPWESNALPPHISEPSTDRLQAHIKYDSILSSDNNFAVFLVSFWALEDTF